MTFIFFSKFKFVYIFTHPTYLFGIYHSTDTMSSGIPRELLSVSIVKTNHL